MIDTGNVTLANRPEQLSFAGAWRCWVLRLRRRINSLPGCNGGNQLART
jgi:hypothetical protein